MTLSGSDFYHLDSLYFVAYMSPESHFFSPIGPIST